MFNGRRIAVLTSGGDAPGMNAAIRAVVRVASARGIEMVGIASTIDNDLAETETTIGVDTALNTSIEYIDRLKDTASSHHRAFIVEVMGRHSGYLALMAAIATGAELAVVPEHDMLATYARGKPHYIVVVAEGAALKAHELVMYFEHASGSFEARLSVMGHVQRGGSPTFFDRLLASQLGAAAVHSLAKGRAGIVTGWVKGQVTEIPLEQAVAPCQKVTPELKDQQNLPSRTLFDVVCRTCTSTIVHSASVRGERNGVYLLTDRAILV